MFNGHWSHGKYGRCSTSLDIWWFLSGIAQITFPYFWFHDIHSPNQKCSFSLKSSLRNKITLLEGIGVWKEITQGKSMTRRCIQDKAVCRKVCRKCRQQCWPVFGGVGANAWDRVLAAVWGWNSWKRNNLGVKQWWMHLNTSTLQHIKTLCQSLVGDVVDSVDGIVGGEGGEVKLIPLPHLSLTKSNPWQLLSCSHSVTPIKSKEII